MNVETDRLIEIFLDLVSINAISKNEGPVAEYISKFLNQLDIPFIEDNSGKIVGGSCGNIVSKIYAGEKETIELAFTAHMDTVKPTLGIKPINSNGKITSDGSTILGADNRAGIAIILYTVESLKKKNIPHHPFEIIFTIGEETGLYGSTHLDMSQVESKLAYTLDSSADPGYFVYAAPGAVDFEVTLQGKASHAAVNPAEGINAISMAGKLIEGFPVGEVDDNTTVNLGTIKGGEANNIIPAAVDITGEIRSFYKENIDKYLNQLSELLKTIEQNSGGKALLNCQESFPGFILDLNSEAIQRLSENMKEGGLTPSPVRYYGASDANVLNSRGLVTIDVGIGAKNPHANNEYILIEDMEKVVRLMHHMVMKKV